MSRIGVILGSGFSAAAGLPLAKGIDSYFERDNTQKLLHFSSDEWKWLDFANGADKINGIVSNDRIAYSYILNELVANFIYKSGSFKNYEEFFQFVLDNLNEDEFLNTISSRAHEKFDRDKIVEKTSEFYDIYAYSFLHPQKNQIINMINHLTNDLLYWRKPFEDFSSQYNPFFIFLETFENREVFTLNHDFLLEAFFEVRKVEYSDGFSIDNSTLQSDIGKAIRTFNGIFDSSYNLVKLHGSIDVYKYSCNIEKGSTFYPTGEYIYFKTHDYYEKQSPFRIDLATGEIVQNFHWNITPQFITGTRKEELIEQDEMYHKLYEVFHEMILIVDTLLIVGYSYGDQHINHQIENSIRTGDLRKIINVNPSIGFPFKAGHSVELVNYRSIEQL